MRKSRGEKVFEAGTREDDSRGGTRAEKFFRRRADIRGWELVFYVRVSATSFERLASTPSSCHATLSILGIDALFQR